MNSLSWLIYAAGVAPNVAAVFAWVSGAFVFLTVAILFIYAMSEGEYNKTQFVKWLIPGAILASLVSALIPPQNTIYAIAASEVGEEIVTNEKVVNTTNKAFQALNSWLDKQITEEPEEKK